MALRGYVTAADGNMYDTLPEGTIKMTATHNFLKTQFWELKCVWRRRSFQCLVP